MNRSHVLTSGLTTEEISSRTEKYGLNKLPEPPTKSALSMLLTQLKDFMVIILLLVAAISFGLQDYIEGVILLIVVGTNVIIGFIQELRVKVGKMWELIVG